MNAELPNCEVEFVGVGHERQLVLVVEATVAEYFDDAHALHCELPSEDFQVPAAQVVQGPPSGPVNPELHLQLVAWPHPFGSGQLLPEFA